MNKIERKIPFLICNAIRCTRSQSVAGSGQIGKIRVSSANFFYSIIPYMIDITNILSKNIYVLYIVFPVKFSLLKIKNDNEKIDKTFTNRQLSICS